MDNNSTYQNKLLIFFASLCMITSTITYIKEAEFSALIVAILCFFVSGINICLFIKKRKKIKKNIEEISK